MKIRILAILLLLGMFSGLLAQVTDTDHPHNLVAVGVAGSQVGTASTDKVCVFCHAPHNNIQDDLLWNHEASAVSFVAFDNAILTVATASAAPGVESAMCLSCHDGSVAVNSLSSMGTDPTMSDVGNVLTAGNMFEAGSGLIIGITAALNKEHPVGIDYDVLEYTVGAGYKDAPAGTDVKFFGANNTMECATCHDVHDNTNPSLLRTTDAASALCLICHTK